MNSLEFLVIGAGWLPLADFLRSWHSVLWIGMAVLVIAQAILSRTRLSESRPLALCVTLSVLAHLLLIIYAYGARLGGPGPGRIGWGTGETVVRLDFQVDDAPDDDWMPDELMTPPTTPPEPIEQPSSLPEAASETKLDQPIVHSETEPPVRDEPTSTAPSAGPPTEVADLDAAADELAARALVVSERVAGGEPGPPMPPAAAMAPVPVATHRHGDDLRREADQQPLPKVYHNRLDADRLGLLIRFGGSHETEAAVQAALAWLVANQAPDGRWAAAVHGAGREARILGQDRGGAGARADTGITGLAVLALMGAGHTHLQGEHREAVQHALEFLLRSQRGDGNLAGDAELYARMYCHGIATLALSEAYAITGDQRLRRSVERAIGYTIASQHPTTGGWRYQPGDTGDMSQFGWQVLALKSAELAGFTIPQSTRTGMVRFLESVTSGRARGLASYRPREQPSRTMTAEALVCRYFLNRCHDSQVQEAAGYLLEEMPGSGQVNFYYWYYATLALHQGQGQAWIAWNQRMSARLVGTQRTTGPQAGTWDPDPVWGNYGGRVFSTALGALCLESYYRYLPLTEPTAHMAQRPK